MSDYRRLMYETVDDGTIATITLNRPKQRNAQHRGLLVELDDAFMQAEADDDVRVVVLRGAGTPFSSGHDMESADMRVERDPDGPDYLSEVQRRRPGRSARPGLSGERPRDPPRRPRFRSPRHCRASIHDLAPADLVIPAGFELVLGLPPEVGGRQ